VKLREIVAELQRELEVRERLYPRWIEEGRISPGLAHERIHALWWGIAILSQCDQLLEAEAVRDSM